MEINDILETVNMIAKDHLDVRTITMGISLLDCCDTDIEQSCEKIKQKISQRAKDLVPVADQLSRQLGIPIINKRLSVTPIAHLVAVSGGDPVRYAKCLDQVTKDIGIDLVGGYSALVQKGFAAGDRALIESIPQALSETDNVCSSVNIGSTRSGINLDAVALMGETIRQAAEVTQDRQCVGATKLVVFCNAVEDNPFMAGAFHGSGEADCEINVGVSGPGVVRQALERLPKDAPINQVAETIKKTAFKVTRMGQLIGSQASKSLGVPFGIVDISLAPTPAVGDSVARILESMGLETVGGHGTVATLALLNDAVKKGGLMAAERVGGLSGAFIPVSEDEGMIAGAQAGVLDLQTLTAMTAVCSVGLDMIAVPGETTAEVLAAIIADEAAIGMINGKTTAVRLIPAIGYQAGDCLEFGGLFGSAPIMPLKTSSPEVFIRRGGHIPAPIQGLKN
ncbi:MULTISPECIES: PFL family protein [Aerococcus]|uniref:PFL family protein n=1 Tax=Aerococcus urinae (strain CCUG 59500 / ACS-120-V-Col10a) TaxID=2976812 RepID=UPI0018C8C9A2|nr:PFL family protein [Aerococcus sp. Group 1]MCY3031394.1 PFL family protein [Aerococcus sp. Group 1]MCY3054293.1 PFL family protein [Aerococcus sp. Group 1]MCY3056023.1 PFL family protein [Aerococcus sp. Group 1]MCY3062115.1 PFL family protein [Aerococcus sp. Group 1]